MWITTYLHRPHREFCLMIDYQWWDLKKRPSLVSSSWLTSRLFSVSYAGNRALFVRRTLNLLLFLPVKFMITISQQTLSSTFPTLSFLVQGFSPMEALHITSWYPKFNGRHFGLHSDLSTNEWAGWQNGVNDDVCAQALFGCDCLAGAMIDERLRNTEWQVLKTL